MGWPRFRGFAAAGPTGFFSPVRRGRRARLPGLLSEYLSVLNILIGVTDDGHAIHYNAVQRGTPVLGSDGSQVGTVDEVVDNYNEHILDGIIFEDSDGRLRFVDGPEVARTAEKGSPSPSTAAEAAELPPPQKAPPRFSPSRKTGRLSKLFGAGWKKQ